MFEEQEIRKRLFEFMSEHKLSVNKVSKLSGVCNASVMEFLHAAPNIRSATLMKIDHLIKNYETQHELK